VARQLVLGVLDSQLAEACDAAMLPEVQFAYDGDVFRALAGGQLETRPWALI